MILGSVRTELTPLTSAVNKVMRLGGLEPATS